MIIAMDCSFLSWSFQSSYLQNNVDLMRSCQISKKIVTFSDVRQGLSSRMINIQNRLHQRRKVQVLNEFCLCCFEIDVITFLDK